MAEKGWLGRAVKNLAPAIGAGVGSIWNSITNRKNTNKTNDANKELAEYAYSKDLEQWNRENAYNSPEQQMLRLEAAGLNPNMVYGTGNAAGNSSTSMSGYNAPTVKYDYQPLADIPKMINTYQDFKMKQAQTNNIEANTMLTATEADVMGSTAEARKMTIRNQNLTSQHQREASLFNAQKAEYDSIQSMADALFKQERNKWIKMGITTSDNVILRTLSKMMIESGVDLKDVLKKVIK